MLKLKVRHMDATESKLTEKEFESLIQLNYVTDGNGNVGYATVSFPADIEVTVLPNGRINSKERFKLVRKVKV